jgi:hypothetical protein
VAKQSHVEARRVEESEAADGGNGAARPGTAEEWRTWFTTAAPTSEDEEYTAAQRQFRHDTRAFQAVEERLHEGGFHGDESLLQASPGEAPSSDGDTHEDEFKELNNQISAILSRHSKTLREKIGNHTDALRQKFGNLTTARATKSFASAGQNSTASQTTTTTTTTTAGASGSSTTSTAAPDAPDDSSTTSTTTAGSSASQAGPLKLFTLTTREGDFLALDYVDELKKMADKPDRMRDAAVNEVLNDLGISISANISSVA